MGEGKSRRSQGARSNSVSNGGAEATTFWRSSLVAGVNFFEASFNASHVVSRHTHDEYSIAVIERGAPKVTCRGAAHLASPGSFLLINPDEPHEGRSAGDRAYRMMYVQPSALARLLDHDSVGLRSNCFPLFRSPIVKDRSLAAEYLRLHRALETESLGALEAESRMLAFLTALIS